MNSITISATPPDTLQAAADYTPEAIAGIATHATVLGRTVAVMILMAFVLIPFAPRTAAIIAILLLHIFAMKTTALLARSMNRRPRLWAALVTVPVISIFATIRLTHLAALILRNHGIKCGDLGISRREMQKYGCPNENSPVTVWKSKINS